MTELKKCPFCGADGIVQINNINPNTRYGGNYHSSVHIRCKESCGADYGHQFTKVGELVSDGMVGKAIKAWNTRHES